MGLWLVFWLPYPQSYKKGFPYCFALAGLRIQHSFSIFYLGWSISRFLENLSPTDVMQLTPSFVLILGILFQITLNTYAIPLTREQTGVVTLPLKRAPMRQGLHPQKVRLFFFR